MHAPINRLFYLIWDFILIKKNKWPFDTNDVQPMKLGEDFKRFEAEINNVENILKSLGETDRRKWEGFIYHKLLQDNLAILKSMKNILLQLQKTYLLFPKSIAKIYGEFINKYEKAIKQKQKSQLMQTTLNSCMNHFQKDMTLRAIINGKLHKELGARTSYAEKLSNAFQQNTSQSNLSKIAAEGKKILSIDSGTSQIPKIRKDLTELKRRAQNVAKVQTEFGDNLKKLLEKP